MTSNSSEPGTPTEREREWADDSETEAAVIAPAADAPLDTQPSSEMFLIVRDHDRLSELELRSDGEWIIGRGAQASIVTRDRQASRRHARLSLRAGALTIEDLGSRNGIVVNGRSLRATTVRIGTGDVVEVGGCQVVVAARAGRVAEHRTVAAEAPPDLVDVVIADPEMARVYASVRKVAAMPTTVLLLGETGTGKDVLAQRLHRWSARAKKSFVRINCAGIPESLLESELFGNERGAFTGAERRRAGYFEAAQGGTILLDEIGELSPAGQAKLLSVLENRTVTRLGGTAAIPIDVRVVCATHRDLQTLAAAERFRPDLFYRVSAFTVRIPPLRRRPAEISLLADVFVRQLAQQTGTPPPTLTPDAVAMLMRYPWPGNVRELRNAVERAFVMADGATIRASHFAPEIRDAVTVTGPAVAPAQAIRQRLLDVERTTIEEALAAENGNQTRAAARLGMPRRTLVHKLTQYRNKGG